MITVNTGVRQNNQFSIKIMYEFNTSEYLSIDDMPWSLNYVCPYKTQALFIGKALLTIQIFDQLSS